MTQRPFEVDLGYDTYAHIDMNTDTITIRQNDIYGDEIGVVKLNADAVENILDAINRAR